LPTIFRGSFGNQHFDRGSAIEPPKPELPRLVAYDYDDIVAALRARKEELFLNHLELDARCGLAAGYTAKVMGLRRTTYGTFNRNLGPAAWDALLSALRMHLIFEREG
jgi:hypothetical protein